MRLLLDLGQSFLTTFVLVAPWLLLGLALGGVISVLFSEAFVRRALGGRGIGPILRSALIGVPLPLCSCSVVPLALSLRRQGASRGSTLSFLVSTPETGVDSIAVTWALMDPVMTVVRPVAAFLTAVLCGLAEALFDKGPDRVAIPLAAECRFCSDPAPGHRHTAGQVLRRALRYAGVDLVGDLAKWLLIGLLAAAVVQHFLPPDFVRSHLGSLWTQIGLGLLVGIPLYTCASATTPLAAALVAAGFSPGAALVLLLVGPATNLATVLLVWRHLGRRAAAIYVGTITAVTVALGFLVHAVYARWIGPPRFRVGDGHVESIGPVGIAAAVLLAGLMIAHFARSLRRSRPHAEAAGHAHLAEVRRS